MKNLADNLQLDDFNHVTASVITYADHAKEFTFQSKTEFLRTLEELPWIGGNTYTDRALDLVLQSVERRVNSVYSGSERALIVVVITDGGATSPFALQKVISKLKRFRFVKIFAIGKSFSFMIIQINNKNYLLIMF